MKVRTEDGKVKDVQVVEVTRDNYIVPENEKHLYHCKIEVRKFDSETGKRLSVPRIQKFGKKVFENNVQYNLKRQGYTIEVLHDPAEYIAEMEAKKAAQTEQAIKAAKAAEEARRKAEIDKAVKAALAEQKAEYEAKLAKTRKSKKEE